MTKPLHIDDYLSDGIYAKDGVAYECHGGPREAAMKFILCGQLGFCGCGSPEASLEYLLGVLRYVAWRSESGQTDKIPWSEFKSREIQSVGPQGAACFVYYVLDMLSLTEHGGCVPGWLSQEGKYLLEDLETLFADEVPE